MKNPSSPTHQKRRGATLVEFSLVFPIFLSVVFFFFEAWRFQQFQQTVDQAALEMGRAAIVPGATADEALARGTELLEAVGAQTAVLSVSPNPITETTDEVTVSVSLPYADVGLFFDFFASDHVFESEVTLETENSRIGRL